VAIYSILAVLLSVTALAAIASAGKLLWDGLSHWAMATETLRVLDQLLLVLMAGPAFWDATADHLFRRHRRWSEKC
jgi:hypothetical protein